MGSRATRGPAAHGACRLLCRTICGMWLLERRRCLPPVSPDAVPSTVPRYLSCRAPPGQNETHRPQPMHFSWSTSGADTPLWLSAPVGQTKREGQGWFWGQRERMTCIFRVSAVVVLVLLSPGCVVLIVCASRPDLLSRLERPMISSSLSNRKRTGAEFLSRGSNVPAWHPFPFSRRIGSVRLEFCDQVTFRGFFAWGTRSRSGQRGRGQGRFFSR